MRAPPEADAGDDDATKQKKELWKTWWFEARNANALDVLSKMPDAKIDAKKDVSTRSPHLFTYLPIPYFPSRIFHVFFSDCAHVFGHDIRRVKEAWRGVASAARVGDSFGVFWC